MRDLHESGDATRPWYHSPAWLSLALLILCDLLSAGMMYGHLSTKVDMLEKQNALILNVLLTRAQQASTR